MSVYNRLSRAFCRTAAQYFSVAICKIYIWAMLGMCKTAKCLATVKFYVCNILEVWNFSEMVRICLKSGVETAVDIYHQGCAVDGVTSLRSCYGWNYVLGWLGLRG